VPSPSRGLSFALKLLYFQCLLCKTKSPVFSSTWNADSAVSTVTHANFSQFLNNYGGTR
jgi:hypothetical protein